MTIRAKASLIGKTNVEKVLKGDPGETGATFTPILDAEGNLSWTNDKGLPNPETINIRGPIGEKGERGEAGKVQTVNGVEPDKNGDLTLDIESVVMDILLALNVAPVLLDIDGTVLIDDDGAIMLNV